MTDEGGAPSSLSAKVHAAPFVPRGVPSSPPGAGFAPAQQQLGGSPVGPGLGGQYQFPKSSSTSALGGTVNAPVFVPGA